MSSFARGRSAASVYIVLQGAWALLWAIAFTLSLVYQVEVAGLTPLQLVLVGTVLEATCFLGEIPTGVVADLYSRKWSVVIGLTMIGVGILIVGLLPYFWPIVIAQVVWGLGYTFVSGAAEAWVTDELSPGPVQPAFTRAHQLGLVMGIVGILISGLLGSFSLQTPIVVGGAGFVLLALLMAVAMRERRFTPIPRAERDSWSHVKTTTIEGVRAARKPGVVRSFLIIALLAGLTSEVFDRLWVERVVNDLGLPSIAGVTDTAVWFTIFALISSLLSLVASLAANRLAPTAVNAEHPTRLMALLVLVQVAGVATFAVSGNLWLALSGRWARDASLSVGHPIQQAWLNRHVTSKARATTLSMMGQADAVGQVAGGPALGALANVAGVSLALVVSSVVHAPAAVIYARLRPGRGDQRN
ncbi:MAG: MFS transporter [Microlunatus sp.]